MFDQTNDLSAAQPARPGSVSLHASPQEVVALLTSCLALVRPVGMTEDEAEDWLSVAMGAVAEYPASSLRVAARKAQKTCTHHAQIVPAIVQHCETNAAPKVWQGAWANIPEQMLAAPSVPQLPAPKLTQADVDRMPPELIKMGLACGALIRDEAGNVRVNPE